MRLGLHVLRLDREGMRQQVVGLHRGIHGVEQAAIRTEHTQLMAQPEQITDPRAGKRSSAALPPLDGVLVEAKALGERLLRQPQRFPDELEDVAGDDAATRLTATKTAISTCPAGGTRQVRSLTCHVTAPIPSPQRL